MTTLSTDSSFPTMAQLHRLRVETYGGGSWVNEFALLTGISTKAFGDMRMFVHVLMEGRLKETLPQTLAKCGYRTLMLFPMKQRLPLA